MPLQIRRGPSPAALLSRMPAWPRPVRWVLAALLLLYLLYFVAGNVYLNTPLFDMTTNQKPEKFQLRTGPGFTVVPGHVVFWNVHVRVHAGRTVQIYSAERASATISLPALLRREIHIPRTDADGVRAVIGNVEDRIEPPPRSDKGWTVRMDEIHSDSIRSGEFGKLLVSGEASATVGFVKQIRGGPSELLPSQAHFRNARISWDGTTLLDQADVQASAHFPRHYRDQAPGMRKLNILTAALKIEGRSQAVRVDTGGAQATVGTVPSTARLQADLAIDHGALRPGGHLVWRLPVLLGRQTQDQGLLALQLDVAEDIRVQARLPPDEDSGNRLDADLRVRGRDVPFQALSALLPRTSGRVQTAWAFDSLNWISDLIVRKPWFRLQGGGTVQADVTLADGQLAPGSTAEIPRVAAVAEVAGVRMQGDAHARGRIIEGRTPQAQVAVTLAEFKAAPGDAPKQVLFDGKDMRMTFNGDARLQELKEGGRVQLAFKDARVPDLARYNRYVGNDQLELLGGAGLLSGDVELDTSGRVGSGHADLRGNGARLRLAGLALSGNAAVQARLKRADFEQKQFDLNGTTVRLQDVRVGAGGDAGWWGEVAIRQGHLSAAAPLRADAVADITLRDAGPILDIFSERGKSPRWVLGLIDSGEVQATGQLRWRQNGQLLVDDLHAENQRLSLRGRLAIGEAGRRGDLYLRWGILGAGIELDGEQKQWHLSGAREWYDGRPRLLPPR